MIGDTARHDTTGRARVLIVVMALLAAAVLTVVPWRAAKAAPTDPITVSNASATEGDEVVFTISLPANAVTPVTGTWKTDGDGSGNAQTDTPGATTPDDDCTTENIANGQDYDDVALGEDGETAAEKATFQIDMGQDEVDVLVPTCGDTFAETNETFTISIDTVVGASCEAEGADCTAEGTILNNDDAPAQLTIADATFTESDTDTTGSFTLTLDKATGQPTAAFDYTVTGDSDDVGDNSTSTITFDANEISKTLDVTIVGDDTAESTETFTVTIGETRNLAAPDIAATGTIQDDDAPPTVVITGDTTNEGQDGTGTCTDAGNPPTTESQCVVFTVALSAAPGSEAALDFNTVNGTATAPQDYVARSGSLTFPAGSTDAKTVAVRVNGDAVIEGNESFQLRVSNVVNAQCPSAAATCTGTGVIAEGAIPITVTNKLNATEGTATTNVAVDINLATAPSGSIEVSYKTTDGTAKAGQDYSPPAANATVTFPAGDKTETVQIPVFADSLDENAEFFTVTALEPSTPGTATCEGGDCNGVVLVADNADDTPPSISVNDPTSVSEGPSETTKTITFTVSLSAPSGRMVAVKRATADGPAGNGKATGGSACPGVDYAALPSETLAFEAGQTSKQVTVTVCGDDFAEANESFFLDLSNPFNATILDGQGVGAITNDDGPAPALSVDDVTASEGTGTTTDFNFTVSMPADSVTEKTVTVKAATSPANPSPATASDVGATSCRPGIDYLSKFVTVSFAPGDTSETVTVKVCADSRDEPATERFKVTLSNPVNGTLDDAEGLGQITDNDAAPSVSVASASVNEDAGPARFLVNLSSASGFPVTVRYATANGTAVAPGDYGSASGTLTFSPGQTAKAVSVPVIPDKAKEGDEAFTLRLSGPTNARLADATATGTILNDDFPRGYWLVGRDGNVFAFGDAADLGSTEGISLKAPIVGMARTPTGKGYWLAASDGGVFAFGDAAFHGSMGGTKLNKPVVGMASSPSGKGYWLVASDGGIFAFGDAAFSGSTGAIPLNQPIVGMAAGPTGGYWLVASDGGIFAFGKGAPFFGSTGAITLNQPIVGMAAAPNGTGYWLVASDGGIFAFGKGARFFGSTGGTPLNSPIVGMATSPTGNGYWLAAADGAVFAFGDAPAKGSAVSARPAAPIVGIADRPEV